jgi:hypothetical protein
MNAIVSRTDRGKLQSKARALLGATLLAGGYVGFRKLDSWGGDMDWALAG